MGGNANFGSRSEFLPGEGCEESNIKYQRYGGCFITYKKGTFLTVSALLLAAAVGLIVYYYVPHSHSEKNEYESADEFLTELNSEAISEAEKSAEVSKISPNIIPSYYRLRIQPYLDENGPKRFTFEGHVAIVFQIDGPPTKSIILNVKNLTVEEFDISLSHVSTSKVEQLKSESQIKEEDNNTVQSTADTDEATTLPPAVPSNDSSSAAPEAVTAPAELDTAPSVNVSSTSSPENNSVSVDSSSAANVTSTTAKPEQNDGYASVPVKDPTSTTSTTEPPLYKVTEQNNIPISRIKFHPEEETLKIYLKLSMEKGVNYTLEIKYSGKLSDGLSGIQRSKFKNENGTRWMVNTLFKPTYARAGFPCFDDQKLKAKFEISIARQTSMAALSNMPLKQTDSIDKSGWVWDHFEISPVMSASSVAFSVVPFTSEKAPSKDLHPIIKAWAQSSIIKKLSYNFEIVPKILESYNTNFGYNYSLPKIDLVAVPNLPVTAVGHWGLILIREDLMIVDNDSSNKEKRMLLNVVARELARQWFGNLITVRSWNESWILDNLCSYIQYSGMTNAESSWNIMDTELSFDMREVLHVDSMNILPKLLSHSPYYEKFETSQQIILDKKGSTMFEALNDILTKDTFKKGLRSFVDKWKYKSIKEDNLWDELVSVTPSNVLSSGMTIKDIIKLWTTQEGYPLISVTRKDNSAIVKQSKYTEKKAPNNNLWILSLPYASSNINESKKLWLEDTSPKTVDNIVNAENNSWIFFNLNWTTLCRVNYDLNSWNSLTALLKSQPDTLSPTSRAQLLDDAFHLARTGILNYSLPLELAGYLRDKEKHIVPWTTALKNIQDLNTVLSKTANYGHFQDYLINLLQVIYKDLDPIQPSKDDFYNLQRKIISWACNLNYKPCRDWAYAQYMTWANFSDPDQANPIHTDMRAVVYCVGVQMRGRSAWEFLWDRYEKAKDKPGEVYALLTGMGCTSETWLIIKYLQRALDEDTKQYSVQMWESLTSDHAVDTAFSFIRNYWDSVLKAYKDSRYALRKVLISVLSRLTTRNDLNELVRFFSTRKSNLKYFAQDMSFIIEKVKQAIDWKKTYLTTFDKLIQNNSTS